MATRGAAQPMLAGQGHALSLLPPSLVFPAVPQWMCSSARTLTHPGTGHMGAHTRGHGAHSQFWVVLCRTWDPRRVGRGLLHGASSFPWWEGGGCPGVRKRREGRRKPLFCVLFLVRKMKWLLGANKGPFETRCSVSLKGPPSLLLPPPQPALAPVCECVTHRDRVTHTDMPSPLPTHTHTQSPSQ